MQKRVSEVACDVTGMSYVTGLSYVTAGSNMTTLVGVGWHWLALVGVG
jgi:hypothetical protein